MQKDDLIWLVIGEGFCKYKKKIKTEVFCKNKYSITGLCRKEDCPLSRSRHATVLEEDGKCVLVKKCVERVNTPSLLWKRVPIKESKEIRRELKHWDESTIRSCIERKKRIEKCIKTREMLMPNLLEIEPKKKRKERVIRKREAKAEKTMRAEQATKRQILCNLDKGVYGEKYKNLVHQWEQEKLRISQELKYNDYIEDSDENEYEVEYVEETG